MTQAHIDRRQAAILVLDVVGYKRLMGHDEEGTRCVRGWQDVEPGFVAKLLLDKVVSPNHRVKQPIPKIGETGRIQV